jgi:limonene-1,2-epoxide hydrolase
MHGRTGEITKLNGLLSSYKPVTIKMKPRQILEKWIEAFNNADTDGIADLYADNAVNHQVANQPIVGKESIRQMFATEFANAKMVCIPDNIFEDGDWAILEWKDPKGLRGCGFFNVVQDKIVFQRGYWDKLSFHKLYGIPLPQ